MFAYLIGGLLILVGVYLVLRWFTTASPKEVLRALRWAGLVFAVLLVIGLLAVGRMQFIWMALFGLLPWLNRANALRRIWKSMRGPRQGNTSTVETRLVRMVLDHDTGEMDGEVLNGMHAGRQLSGLSTQAVIDLLLWAQQDDAKSAQLLEAFLDRMRPDWQDAARAGAEAAGAGAGGGGDREGYRTGPRGRVAMTPDEARRVLDLGPDATEADIKAAHRRLMKHAHPDSGGSDEEAARINEAKDVLMAGVKRG